MAEDPKQILAEMLHAGIGKPKRAGRQTWIDFEDDHNHITTVRHYDEAPIVFLIPNEEAQVITLSKTQARRLAHTLEFFARTGRLGYAPEEPYDEQRD